MANRDYTPIEIIDITIANLNNISVPAGLTQQISIPLAQNITNLRILKQKLEEQNAEPAEDVQAEPAEEDAPEEESPEG